MGGNQVKVNWFSESTNLHRVWDDHLITSQGLSYTEMTAAIDFTTKSQVKEWQSQPLSQWLYESYTLSNQIHIEVEPGQKLSYEYIFRYKEIMNEQLLKGGVRLAGLLNEMFKNL